MNTAKSLENITLNQSYCAYHLIKINSLDHLLDLQKSTDSNPSHTFKKTCHQKEHSLPHPLNVFDEKHQDMYRRLNFECCHFLIETENDDMKKEKSENIKELYSILMEYVENTIQKLEADQLT
jgi:hypothetical protein